jgi:anti-sigma B factor antagonist
MKISVRQKEGFTILDVKGKITIGAGDVALREAIQGALDAGAMKVLVNLGDVSTIDSSGIGELVSAFTSASNRGASLALVQLPPKVQDILQITQLVTVFDVYDDENEAMQSMS